MNISSSLTLLVGILGSLAAIATLLNAWITRRKVRADTATVYTDISLRLVGPLDRRVQQLEAEKERMQRIQSKTLVRLSRMESTMSTVVLEILDPDATIPRLREIAVAARHVLDERLDALKENPDEQNDLRS